MLRALWLSFVIFGLFKLMRWEFNLAGDTDALIPPDSNVIYSVNDLLKENLDDLPDEVYAIFKQSAGLQMDGDLQAAAEQYTKLRAFASADGRTLNLSTISTTFQHNWDLLQEALAHR
jgi:hypothetical protein